MKEIQIKKQPSLKQSLVWPAIVGFVFGMLSIAGFYYHVIVNPMLKFYVWLLTVVPMLPFIALVNQVLELEGEQTLFYVLASPIVWSLVGLLIGYAVYRARVALIGRAQYFKTTTSWQRNMNRLRIVLALMVTVILGVMCYRSFNDLLQAKRENEILSRQLAQELGQQRQKKINEQLKQIKTPLRDNRPTAPAQPSANEETLKRDEQPPANLPVNLTWSRYTNAAQGITFEYPTRWEVQPKDFGNGEFALWIIKPTANNDDPLKVVILGTTKNFIPDHPDNITGGCAYSFQSMDEFCQKKCEKLNDSTAIDFRSLNRGEPIFSAAGFSVASTKFPRLCVEMPLEQILSLLVTDEDTSIDDLVQRYDLGSVQTQSELPAELFEAITVFRHIAGSLAPAR